MKNLPSEELKRYMQDPLIAAIVNSRVGYVRRVLKQWERMFGKGELVEKSKPGTTMTVMQAFNICRDTKQTFMVDSTPFALVGWKNDEGKTSGPFVVTVWLAVAVEIGENGRFRDMFPAGAEGYFPWMEEKRETAV